MHGSDYEVSTDKAGPAPLNDDLWINAPKELTNTKKTMNAQALVSCVDSLPTKAQNPASGLQFGNQD